MQQNLWCHADLIIFTDELHNENLLILSSVVFQDICCSRIFTICDAMLDLLPYVQF